MTNRAATTPAVWRTFTASCPCGTTVQYVNGVERPHEHQVISPQDVCDAWAEGYAWARWEAARDAGLTTDDFETWRAGQRRERER